jgi:hydrogenase nickel incorporation protein HypA/HybF
VHELGIANEILGIALAEAERHAAKKVTSIRLRVGVLRAIEPEHLSFLFAHLAHGTPADGARLEILEEPVRVECPACGSLESPSIVWECPRCKGSVAAATGGDSLEIVSLEVDV